MSSQSAKERLIEASRVDSTHEAVPSEGKKQDDGKLRYHLMPDAAEQEILAVLDFGADKYGEFNWQEVKPLNTRYYNAMRRHVTAFRSGEREDPETGRHHLAHAACCLLFMLENDLHLAKSEEPLPAMLQRQAI